MFQELPKDIHPDRVFLYEGQPFDSIKTAFVAACRRGGIEDFRFHDLRHTALNNLRLAGNDCFRIMAILGHKTMSVFKRYNMVTEEKLGKPSGWILRVRRGRWTPIQAPGWHRCL